ncbi:unnamed protein product [Diatraea saccharalis]|uniref:C2H2-type domain-containing protein n=1 Tax=Diatraea saccharalis TaxID=40085 RepID=A0A9N9R5D0_9NEOP|nr:unnamed protein product [Diatraea saccharalis]
MGQDTVGKQTTKNKRPCYVCNKLISGNSYCFRAHLYQHKQVPPRYDCLYCSKQYFRKDVYEKHLEVHTGRTKVFVCDYCDRSFVDKRNLISHLHIHEDNNVYIRPRYNCRACGAKYCEERLLKYHIRKEHFNLQQKDESIIKKPINETWVERVLESNVCVQMTKINNNVISIKKCGTFKKEVKQEVDENDKFITYVNSVFGCNDKSQYSKAICDYCNKEMLKKSLPNHIRERHLNIRKFICDICKRSFNRHYQMTDHRCGKKVRRSCKGTALKAT